MSSGMFGRDEMNALIGGSGNGDGPEEMAAFRQSAPTSRQPSSSKGAIKEVDISKMSAAETAKMLSEKGRNSVSNNSSRYRSQNKVLAHHQLLAEELSKQQQMQQEQKITNEGSLKREYDDPEDDEEAEFLRERRPVQAAVVISRKPTENRRRRRRSDSSSSSSSSDESQKRSRRNRRDRRRNRDDSSSDSSSSDEEDDRRRNKRVLASRRMQEDEETLVPKLQESVESKKSVAPKRRDEEDGRTERKPCVERMISQVSKLAQRPSRTDSSSDDGAESDSSSSSSSSDSSSSSSSESSSDEDEPVRLKPVFVPKHKRNLVQSEESRLEEEDLKLQLAKERKLKRKAESRALLAKELAAAESALQNDDDDDQDDEYGGATNAPPNDDDEVDKERERNEWEIREIARLLKSIDELELRRKEEEEYARRKNLTDAECLKEDMESGRYQAPGANRDKRANESGRSNHNQRFFHRGAFYMDESEWKEGDIREKAADYAATATGEDLIDRSKLPEVMQVKNFGHARQNTRYKGLAKEDTTDKHAHILPLRKNQK